MRLGLLVIALAACSASASARPAWPKPTPREVDGGESLAPRATARAITAIVETEKPTERAEEPPAVVAPAAAPAPAEPAATPASSSAPAAEEPMITEEIVIEIED